MRTIIQIRNSDLETGMKIMRERNGKFEHDCTLAKFFVTSLRFPHLAWITTAKQKVVFQPCGRSWIEI